jgi:uncharacterized protein YjgD (DUF1641 family)
MQDINQHIESPFQILISFNKLLEHYETVSENADECIATRAKYILKTAEEHPILRDGFSDPAVLEKKKTEIGIILQDAFSQVLTKNEIKTASIPFYDLTFNPSERFKSIVETAGKNFELKIKNMPKDDLYIVPVQSF